jgi:Protein of unknown function (DUF2505)
VDFRVEQRIAAPVSAVAVAYTDPTFYDAATGTETLSAPVLLDRQETPEGIVVHFRMGFIGALAGPARAFVEPEKLTWVTTATLEPPRTAMAFSMHPDFYESLLTCSGNYTFADAGDATLRTVTGTLSVHVPIVGGGVERTIVNGLEQYLNAEGPVLESWSQRHSGS